MKKQVKRTKTKQALPQAQPGGAILRLMTTMGLALLLTSCQQTVETAVIATPIFNQIATQAPAIVATPTLANQTKSGGTAPSEPTVQPATALPAHPTTRSIGDVYTPELGNLGYDVQSYTLQLALDPATPHIQGLTIIDAIATTPNLTQLSLDLVGFTDITVSKDGSRLNHLREGDKLIVELPTLLSQGEPFSLTIAYAGPPTKRRSPYVGFVDTLGMTFTGEMLYVLAEPDGARFWFPNNDHPRDKALYRFELTVPEGLTAVANGLLQTELPSTMENGRSATTFIWEHNAPMAPYLATVAVGDFERIESVSPNGVPLRHYVTSVVREDFTRVEAVTGESIDWLSQFLGPYPFEVMGFVTVDSPPTALETQTLSVLSYELVGARTAVHEIVHMWFGNHVSLNSWSEMWRNEGFATYFSIMWELDDHPEALDQRMLEMAGAVEQNEPQYPLRNPPPEQLFGFNTYFKGAIVVHALRRELGDDAFFMGLQLYLERYGGGTASDAQFQAIMEEVSGRSLDNFFNEWLS